MRARWIDGIVGAGLLLGPLAYALTLEPEVVERVEIVEVERSSPDAIMTDQPVIPVAPRVLPVVPPQPAPMAEPVADDDRIAFAFMSDAGLVLSTAADTTWGKGRLRGHKGSAMYRAAKKADGAAVPQSLWAQRGRTFDLYDADGKRCTVALGDLFVFAQHDGPDLFDLFDGGMGDLDYDQFSEQTIGRAQIREQVWSWAEETEAWLVADIIGDSSCDGALWARDASLPAPRVLTHSTESTATTERRVAQHLASEQLVETRRAYTEWYSELPAEELEYYDTWDSIEAAGTSLATWRDADGQERLVEMVFGSDEEMCGEGFSSLITAVDHVVADGFEPSTLSVGADAIFDADLDGKFEQLFVDGIDVELRLESETIESSLYVERGFECPC